MSSERERVLIVDDSLTVRMDLAEAFSAADCDVFPCGSVAEARAIAARGSLSAAVLDVLLPDGDGVLLLHELRERAHGADLVIVMLSSEREIGDRVRALHTGGADEYVGKPYDRGYVVAKTRELLRARAAASSSSSSSSSPPPRTLILVIDDSLTFREALRQSLEDAGYAVETAADGEEGLKRAAQVRPAAILVDGNMPGIDGATVIRRVRLDEALRAVPCVLLTASDERDAELQALDAGADAFVRKEEDAGVVLAKLSAALRTRESQSESSDATARVPSLLGPMRVLCVDSADDDARSFAAALRGDGVDVMVARSSEQALALLGVQRVDCVLLDRAMPGRSAEETCRRIKAVPGVRDIPVLLVSDTDDRAVVVQALAAGADDVVHTQSGIDVLRARVRAQLRRKQFEDEHRRIRDALMKNELDAVEARAAQVLAETRAALVSELERKNGELEAFSYSVSHDLRAPLRSIDGFSQALAEDYAALLDERGQDYVRRVRSAVGRMGELIDDLLELSRVGRAELVRERTDLSLLARVVGDELARAQPERSVAFEVATDLVADGDARLLRVVLENLLGNAWKFSGKTPNATVRFFQESSAENSGDRTVYVISDNGAGFNPAYAEKLFRPFQRLHAERDFAGTGIGLATVHRIIDRHGGRVWAESSIGHGATFRFTLPRTREGRGRKHHDD